MSFPRYQTYKDSGVEWLGPVPEHWGTSSLRWLTRRYSGGTPDKTNLDFWENGSIPWLNSGAVNDRLITKPSAYISDEAFQRSSAKWIPSGALVMALAGQGKTKGMVAQLLIDSTCNQSMAAIIPQQGVDARFLFWWLDSNYENIRNLAGGDLRDGLNLELLGNILCPLMPVEEQQAIARFLDRETTKIDALIAEQERLSELLKEKRQAFIAHAVTKGLDPNAAMRASGVEELGHVPAHWQVHALKWFATLQRGYDLTEAQFEAGPYPVITSGGPAGFHSSFKARGPGVVTGRYGSTGRLFWVDEDFWPHNTALYVRDFRANNRRFIWYVLQSIDLEAHSAKSAVPGIDRNDIHTLRVCVPPVDEQETIAERLDVACAESDATIASAQAVVELLRERRSALISAAVTGQIDVRV